MKLGITEGLRRARRVWRRRQPGIVILMYHRVADVECDPYGLAVPPGAFREQVEALARSERVLPLPRAREAIESGRVPGRAFVVTFDDGYRDNLTVALPELERAGVPATVFVTTAAVDAREELWWDLLERAVLGPREVPEKLEIETPNGLKSFDFSACRIWTEAARAERVCRSAWEAPPGSRMRTYHELCRVIQPLEPALQHRIARAACEWAGVTTDPRPTSATMTRDEVAALSRSPLVEIGGHTTTHLQMSAHDAERQRRDVVENRAFLQEIVGEAVVSFAYPYGAFGADSAAVVRDAGFAQACTTVERSARAGADAFLLPRFPVPAFGGDRFERWLADCFGL